MRLRQHFQKGSNFLPDERVGTRGHSDGQIVLLFGDLVKVHACKLMHDSVVLPDFRTTNKLSARA